MSAGFLGTVLYTVAFKNLLLIQLLNYLNSTDTDGMIKGSRRHLKIVSYKLKGIRGDSLSISVRLLSIHRT